MLGFTNSITIETKRIHNNKYLHYANKRPAAQTTREERETSLHKYVLSKHDSVFLLSQDFFGISTEMLRDGG